MKTIRTHHWSTAIAIAAIAFVTVPSATHAQETSQTTFQVLVNGTPIGAASSATNLPADSVVLRQDFTTNLPRKQVESDQQGTVVLTSADPALISAIQSWLKADNSGYKNTVQRKTMEIDRLVGNGTTTRYRLSGAWPTRINSATSSTGITIVYQRVEIIR